MRLLRRFAPRNDEVDSCSFDYFDYAQHKFAQDKLRRNDIEGILRFAQNDYKE